MPAAANCEPHVPADALLNGTGHCVETGTSQMLHLTTLLIGGDDETIAGRRISLELRGRGLDRIGAGIPIANENGRANVLIGDC